MKRSQRILLLPGCIFFVLLAMACTQKAALEPLDVQSINVGDPVPDWSLVGINNETAMLADTTGKVLVLDYWATWCTPCVAGMPELERLSQQYAQQGLLVWGLSVDKQAKTVKKFLRSNPLMRTKPVSYRMLHDKTNLLSRVSQFTLPYIWIVDRTGILRHVLVGSQSVGLLEDHIKSLLREPNKG